MGIDWIELAQKNSLVKAHAARMWERRGVYRVLVGQPEGKSHLGDPDVMGG